MLAVITTELGVSFIDRHVEDLLPGKTVVVARMSGHAFGGSLQAKGPALYLDRWKLRLSIRLARRAGASEALLRDWTVRRFLRKHRVSVVLGEFLDQFLDYVPLLDQMKVPYVVQGHGIDLSAALCEKGMATRYLAYRSARAILTRSEFHRQRLIRHGLPEAKIHVNPGGVDVPPQPPQRALDANTRFLALGRMVPKKGPIYLLEAFRLASNENPEITLDFIGDGPLFSAVQQFVQACGLAKRVCLHRLATEELKRRLFLECGVFIQHSIVDPEDGNEEGLPASTQEAMAHSMAVISTRHAGIPEAVQHGVTGLLVTEGDVQQMKMSMLKILSCASGMGKAGYDRAVSMYSWNHERSRLKQWLDIR